MTCKKCGGNNRRVTLWDGARSGGQTYTCLDCGYTEQHGCKMVTYKRHNIILSW